MSVWALPIPWYMSTPESFSQIHCVARGPAPQFKRPGEFRGAALLHFFYVGYFTGRGWLQHKHWFPFLNITKLIIFKKCSHHVCVSFLKYISRNWITNTVSRFNSMELRDCLLLSFRFMISSLIIIIHRHIDTHMYFQPHLVFSYVYVSRDDHLG